jgi:hypothetical protein
MDPTSAEAALVRICNLSPATATLLVHGRLPDGVPEDGPQLTWGSLPPAPTLAKKVPMNGQPAPAAPGSGGAAGGPQP